MTAGAVASPRGAYGFRVVGGEDLEDLLVAVPADWPAITLVRRQADPPGSIAEPTADTVGVALACGGNLVVERAGSRATFTTREPMTTRALAHPHLSVAAAMLGHWAGHELFHAAAFAHAGGVWALLGDKESGKSSTVAWLALHGCDVMCDDLLAVRAATDACAGPRCVDLRKEAATRLEAGEPLDLQNRPDRWRLPLPPVAATLPLRGWVSLAWRDTISVEPIPAPQRLARLAANRTFPSLTPEPERFLQLACLPAFELGRPHDFEALPDAAELLLKTVGEYS